MNNGCKKRRVKPLLSFHFELCPCTILNYRKKYFLTYSLKTVREACENVLVFDTLIQQRQNGLRTGLSFLISRELTASKQHTHTHTF